MSRRRRTGGKQRRAEARAAAIARVPEPSLEARRALTDEVIDRLHASGFPLVGICDARPSVFRGEYERWIAEGRHGEMAYLAAHVQERLDPAVLVPAARSVICVADRHHDGRPARRDAGGGSPATDGAARLGAPPPVDRPTGRIARYAQGGDYHEIIRSRIEPLAREWRTRFRPHRFRVCVDTAPILEREHAQRAGLGRIGKHTLLIAEGLGSWLSLGEIVTSFPLLPRAPAGRAVPAPREPAADPCGTCTRCIDACPTGAIAPWSVDAARCLSYLTIEHAGKVDPALEAKAGEWLFGCDVCQEVCPHNQPTRRSKRAGFNPEYAPRVARLDLLEILGWTDADYAAADLTAVLRRASLSMLQRTATAILANQARGDRSEHAR